jgi:hypothetical protein
VVLSVIFKLRTCAQKERHEEMIKSTLTVVKAIAQVPQALTMVPAFKTFLDTKVLNNNSLAPIYAKIEL